MSCSILGIVLPRVATCACCRFEMSDGGFNGRGLEGPGGFACSDSRQEAFSVDLEGEELGADESELILTVQIGGGILLQLFVDAHDSSTELVLVTWP